MYFDRSPVVRTLRVASLLPALLLCTGDAEALGLGKLTVHSRLGASFKAEVQLIENAGDIRLAGECFGLASSGDTDSDIPILIRGHIRLERQGGQSKLIIASDQLNNEPALQINLRAGCGAEVVRSYTVLIDPEPPDQLVENAKSSHPPANKMIEPARTAQHWAPGSAYPSVWQTAQGETAQSITRALFPRQPKAQRRFLAALQAENQQVELGLNGDAPLDVDTVLSIPDTRRKAYSSPAVGVGQSHASKGASPGVAPEHASRKKAAAQKLTGRMADRLVLSGDANEGNPKPDAPLRASETLSTRLSSKVSENSRALLRTEYKLLSALYVQAEPQLATADKIRNLEASFEEIRVASENAVRQISLAMAPATSAQLTVSGGSPVTISPPSTVNASTTSMKRAVLHKSPAPPRQETRSSWWLEILFVLGLLGVLTWAFFRQSGKRLPVLLPIAADKPPFVPPIVNDEHQQWAVEDKYETIQQAKTSIIVPDIVLDEAEDCRTVMEVADVMVSYGRINGAVQTLEEFLTQEPSKSLVPWLKLLEIYRMNEMREEFQACSIRLRTYFNVAPASWEIAEYLTEPIAPGGDQDVSIEELLQKLPEIGKLPHIKEIIQNAWISPDGSIYLKRLLRDTRDGKRGGFPLVIARQLQFLLDFYETRFSKKA